MQDKPTMSNGLSLNIANKKTGLTGKGLPFSILNPYRVVHFIEYTGKSSDTTKPTSPTNLKASNIDTKSLTLTWTASTDDVGVTNYLIYKDNVLLETVGNILSYSVTGLSTGTSYNFSVIARDAAGNLSPAATVIAATVVAPIVNPTLPTLQHAYYGGENMTLQWPNYIDSGDITYELYRSINGGGSMLLQTSTNTFYYDKLSNGLTYSYQIRINSNGYTSGYSNTVTVTGRS
jgi:chitodextrinase